MNAGTRGSDGGYSRRRDKKHIPRPAAELPIMRVFDFRAVAKLIAVLVRTL
jgi:hypothetical protein